LVLRFFVGDVIIGVGLGIFGPCQPALGLNPKRRFFVCFHFFQLAKICIFWGLVWPSSVYGCQIMVKKHNFCKNLNIGLWNASLILSHCRCQAKLLT